MTTNEISKGRRVYVTAEQSGYLGAFKVASLDTDGNVTVTNNKGQRGRVRPDQCYPTKVEALTAASIPGAGWAAAAQLSR